MTGLARSEALPVDRIVVGDRDREDMGDIAALADSIRSVGMLHPVVVTESLALVAGGRRLEAVRQLGWVEVLATVVDLSNVADVLQAESDENTQRKGLTPYEAARARERRARVLAEDAARRQRDHAGTAPGRSKAEVTSSKLDEVKPSDRATRKAAAIGTGYSGTTLDKVDTIRSAAERGVVRQGREEIPVPEPVREVARQQLQGVKQTGAAVDRAHRAVTDAVSTYVGESPDRQRAALRNNLYRAIAATEKALPIFDAATAADVCDDEMWQSISNARQAVWDWSERVDGARLKGLRLIGGVG